VDDRPTGDQEEPVERSLSAPKLTSHVKCRPSRPALLLLRFHLNYLDLIRRAVA
jgi:hypothetical protein